MSRRSAIGVSWGDVGDVGKAAFPYVHATGKAVASAFGAGAAAQSLEDVERKQGWLPSVPQQKASPKLPPNAHPMHPPAGFVAAAPLAGGPPALTNAPLHVRYRKPLQYAAGAALVAGALGLIIHFLKKRS